ncbi:MAG: cadherin-like domain-containing protein [Oscillospiraceae bacterium]|nr:cadherin-like domain-containing protein [Oscillospiraceae bacterium]
MKQRVLHRFLALSIAGALSFALPASATLFGAGQEPEALSVAAFSKNGLASDVISFSPEDFRVEGNAALRSIVVTSLPDPSAGMLTIGNQAVPQGSEVAVAALDGLRFTPLATPMLSATSFTFSPLFDNGAAGEDVTVGLYLLASANEAPVAENLSLCTYKNVEIQGTFAGVDPEGDLLTFQLISKPARGAVTQEADGSTQFTYTPYENKTGKDAFTYVAVDAVGNTSAPATVSIKIEKQKTKICYSDMTGVEGHRDAVRLAEAGLLIGEQMGNEYLFHPEQTVSRAQFTALAMAAAGLEVMTEASMTGFADDDVMAAWAKPYVSSALRSGVVQGSLDQEGRVVFQAGAPITAAEAAVLLNRTLRVTDVSETFVPSGMDTPPWCAQAVANLNSCNALPASAVLSEPLTRSQAAVMLSAALDVMETRDSGGWFQWD